MTKETQKKTHWLQTDKKNYLTFPDLPSGEDVILTIKSAVQEEVENPCLIIDKKPAREMKRVIRFEEKRKWLKPFICNQTNADTIMKCTGEDFMEDVGGKKIKIGVSNIKMYSKENSVMETVGCLRVRKVSHNLLTSKKISKKQIETLEELLLKTDKTAANICLAYKVEGLSALVTANFDGIVKSLKRLGAEQCK